jgi:hypothetical protein
LTIQNLGRGSSHYFGAVGQVEMLGSKGALPFSRDSKGLAVTLPGSKPNEHTCVLKITHG